MLTKKKIWGLQGLRHITDSSHTGCYTQCVARLKWDTQCMHRLLHSVRNLEKKNFFAQSQVIYWKADWTKQLKPREEKDIDLYTVKKNVFLRLPIYFG